MDSSDIEEDIILFTALLLKIKSKNKKIFRKKVVWVNSYLQKRSEKGRYVKDFQDICNEPFLFKENFRVNLVQFEYLYSLLEQSLMPKVDARPADKITPKEQLCMTLEYLASGGLERHIASCYRVSKQRLGYIIDRTCHYIIEVLKSEHAKEFEISDWIETGNKYNYHWNFPNCLGAVDGKHVQIRCPKNSGTAFFNYKGFFSINLMAVADSNYRFIYVDVGAYGSESDSTVFQESNFGKKLFSGNLNIPDNCMVYGKSMPYVFLGDDAFPLHKHIMKPFKGPRLSDEQRIFNYRLSRARRCVENAFGVLCARFICIARTILSSPDKAQNIVTACCLLHNFLMNSNNKNEYCPPDFTDKILPDGSIKEGTWRKSVQDGSMLNNSLESENYGRPSNFAKRNRDHLMNYFLSDEGKVHWQNESIFL